MRHPSRVLEVLPLVNGLFAHMDYTFWDFTSQELDILMQSRFGQRPIAPLIDIIQGPPLDPFIPRPKLTDAQLTQLASIILHTFKNKWDRLGAIHSLEYDVLKNYLDEYTEVLRDDTDASTLRETERADENSEVSRLSTTSGTEGEQANVSSNESTNIRSDDFNSEFARVSKDSQVRVDDLEESKVRSESTSEAKVDDLEDSKVRSESTVAIKAGESEENYSRSLANAQARTDNLTDATVGSGTNNKTISGGNYAENTQRSLTSSGTGNTISGLYGFNSDSPVNDSTSDVDASKAEAETVAKTVTGQRTENVSLSDNTSVTHTGTQGTVSDTDESGTKSVSDTQSTDTDVDESYVKSNTGTQSTDTDVDEAYVKANKGSQNIEEDTSISDTTHTTDEQENTSVAHGSSSASNSSTSTTDSDSESNKSSVSRLNDSVIVNTALSRARESIHKGNIGNLTPQQLITQEIELWRWNFIDEVMSDIKSMITIPIYV